MNSFKQGIAFIVGLLLFSSSLSSQSTAHHWIEFLLQAIREDLARPTVHARNLWHTSAAMYDAWALFDEEADPFLIGNTIGDYSSPFDFFPHNPADKDSLAEVAIDFAAYHLLRERFWFSLNAPSNYQRLDAYMQGRGYDLNKYDGSDVNYSTGSAIALGTYIGRQYDEFGNQDGANENGLFRNLYYEPVNEPINPFNRGNKTIDDPNRWQTIDLPLTIDQSGNRIENAPPFLSPEWGNVEGFALPEPKIMQRDSHEYKIFYDPGPPPYIDTLAASGRSNEYQWGFAMVVVWSSHTSPEDSIIWDISPQAQGNMDFLPETFEEYKAFYNYLDGGDPGKGRSFNPATGEPYEPNLVYRGDYVRALAEFWADGPDSETPPGHWFTILNKVNLHPDLIKRFNGRGPVLSDLEWDLKSYFLLGASVHDAAISTWTLKGYYDYLRPVSAIRLMAEFGQSTNPELPSYHVAGLPLIPGYIELIMEGDTLAGEKDSFLHEVKVLAWNGPSKIKDPLVDQAGVGWIRAKEWWPYQRPTFVSPNFSGYVSGHSTYSRAAAEILTEMTGDPFFPGGMGVFEIEKDTFLVFEEGPSETFELQWATYRDASDQTSLSRIWGGIHPPCDDIPGRKIGIEVADAVYTKAIGYFYDDKDGDGLLSFEDCDDTDPKRPLKRKCRKTKKRK